MTYDDRDDDRRNELHSMVRTDEASEPETNDEHLVFDFTDVHTAGFSDLALILTARLHTPPGECVWVRGIQPRTARILEALGLDHLFRRYPGSETMH